MVKMENLKKRGLNTGEKKTATYYFLGRTGTGMIADLDEVYRLLRGVIRVGYHLRERGSHGSARRLIIASSPPNTALVSTDTQTHGLSNRNKVLPPRSLMRRDVAMLYFYHFFFWHDRGTMITDGVHLHQ
jgi:hypothetical protein